MFNQLFNLCKILTNSDNNDNDLTNTVQELFEICSNKSSSDNEIIKLINQINNVNVTKNINGIIHNPLTCYIMFQNNISELVLLKFIEKNINLGYKITITPEININDNDNDNALLLYSAETQVIHYAYEMFIIKSTNNNSNVIRLLFPPDFPLSNRNNLLLNYLTCNNNTTVEIIDYLIESGSDLFYTTTFKNKMIHNALTCHLNNKNIKAQIIKKLVAYEELRNHIIIIHNEIYNIVTYYIISTIKNKTQINSEILTILLNYDYISPFIMTKKLDNYRHNALLLYLKKVELSIETCENAFEIINILMSNEHNNFINPGTVLYKNDRVHNILTWYLTNVKEPNIKIMDHLLTKGVNIHFIDNRSNNISELYLLRGCKKINLEILRYLYEKKVKFNEYCLSYYFQNSNPEGYEEQIVEYLLKICELQDHSCWINVDDGGLYNTLSLYFPHLEQVQIIGNSDIQSKSYFRLYCYLS